MTTGKIEANKEVLMKIFSDDFWFTVPEYQRSYVWQKDNISELIEDLTYSCENKSGNEYFLGSLVLKKLPNSNFPEYEVLDGQQRLTTLFIMMAVLRDLVSDVRTKERLQKNIYQQEDWLVNVPERMRITYRIRDAIEDFIKQYVIKENGTTYIENIKEFIEKDNVSLGNMANAIIIMNDIFSKRTEVELMNFIKYFLTKAIFIYVSTDNTEDAFRMFTILNDRGIPLTNADILKSENIGAISHENDIERYAKLWEEIENRFGNRFDKFLQHLRAIIIKEKAKATLLDEFKDIIYKDNKLQKGEKTFEFIKLYSDIYDNIIELEDDRLSNEFKNLITIMRIAIASEDWVPPLMFFFNKFKYNKLDEFLKKLEQKLIGDIVCEYSPSIRMEAMNKIIKAIDVANNVDELLNTLKIFEVNKDDFIRNINADIYKKTYAKYLLLKYEFLKSDNSVHINNYKKITIEHVLPQNPSNDSQWVNDFGEIERKEWTNKLANLVLLSKIKNSKLSNLDFEEKKKRYLSERMDIFNANKVFLDTTLQWTPKLLEKRQKEMVECLSQSI